MTVRDKDKNVRPKYVRTNRQYGRTNSRNVLDIDLYIRFITGEFCTKKQRDKYKMKKLASRICQAQTVTVHLRPNNKWSYGL